MDDAVAAQVVKAANPLIVAGIYALASEAISLLDVSGVDAKAGLDVLAGNGILELERESMIACEFEPGFRIDLHHMNMGSSWMPRAGPRSRALDHSALLKVIESVSGRGEAASRHNH